MTLHPSPSGVLVVVDVQMGFITEYSAPVVPVIADLLDRWQSAGGASILTRFVNAPGSTYVRLIGWSELMPGDPSVDLAPEVARFAPAATAVIDKGGYTALTPDVLALIAEHGWTDIVIAGMDTDSCVLATALTAFEAGLTPWVVTDACAAHAGPSVHEAALLVMSRFLGARQLVTSDQDIANR